MKIKTIPSILAAVAAVGPIHAAQESAAPRPNIVLILADDLGYGDLGCYGAAKIKTPNIDRLADGGMRFTDAHASPLCTPTRYSILTGRYPIRNERLGDGGVVFPKDPLVVETDRPTLGSFIRDLGYDTGLFGKWHLGFGTGDIDWNGVLRPGPLECGFNTFFGVPTVNSMEPKVFVRDDRIVGLDPKDPIVGRVTSSEMKGGAAARYEHGLIDVHHADEALAWLRRKRDRPFFLFFPTISIHSPEVPYPDFKGKSEAGFRGDFVVEHDHRVGQILRALDEMGVAENTLVIYASDNGGMDKLGATNPEKSISRQYGHKANGDWRGMKSDVWEGGHRVPLIVRWPGHVAPGTASDALVGLNDVFATIADLLAACRTFPSLAA
jgi:arylsulfatase A-like enzyme